jgi:hypothetical protein
LEPASPAPAPEDKNRLVLIGSRLLSSVLPWWCSFQ